jgi:hypothetical protein
MKQVPQTDALETDFGVGEAVLPERLPWPLAAVVIGGLSLVLWGLIFAALRAFS